MTHLESNRLYYYSLLEPENRTPLEGSSSLIQGLSFEPYMPPEEGAQGALHWFDKIQASVRSIDLVTAPPSFEKKFTVIDRDGWSHSFQYVDREVYDTLVRKLLPTAPLLRSEQEIQEYLKRLNPYL